MYQIGPEKKLKLPVCLRSTLACARFVALFVYLLARSAGALPSVALSTAEAQLDALENLPLRGSPVSIHDGTSVERVLRSYLAQRLQTARVASDLGRLLNFEGCLREAATLLAKYGPPDEALLANRRLEIARLATPRLPGHSHVFRVEAFGDGWALLTAEIGRSPLNGCNEYSDIRLMVLSTDATVVRWQVSVRDPRDLTGANEVRLYVVNLMDDNAPAVVITLGTSGPRGLLSYVQINRNGARPLLSAASDSRVAFEQRDHRWYVWSSCRVGVDLEQSEAVLWPDVYGYSPLVHGYQQVDAEFPDRYAATEQELRRKLGRHPDNWQLLEYLARAQEVDRHPRQAIELYQRAMEQARKYMAPLSLSARASTEREVQEMRVRVDMLTIR